VSWEAATSQLSLLKKPLKSWDGHVTFSANRGVPCQRFDKPFPKGAI
jgi:hypothetical protein